MGLFTQLLKLNTTIMSLLIPTILYTTLILKWILMST